jgi:hypothetical protein
MSMSIQAFVGDIAINSMIHRGNTNRLTELNASPRRSPPIRRRMTPRSRRLPSACGLVRRRTPGFRMISSPWSI